MKFVIESGTTADIDELEKLYDDLNDYLSATTNYPGWIKGIYPIREDAIAGIENNTLFMIVENFKLILCLFFIFIVYYIVLSFF